MTEKALRDQAFDHILKDHSKLRKRKFSVAHIVKCCGATPLAPFLHYGM